MTEQVVIDSTPLTVKEAAAYLKVSIHTVHRWTSKGTIPFYKPNGRVLWFKKEDLDAWVFRNRNIPAYEMVGKK